MRKLMTLTFALLFSAGMAYGQSATTNQNGSGNDATIMQTQNSGGNDATVDQMGDDNLAKVEQTFKGSGNNNSANVAQTGDENMVKNISQVGNDNEFIVNQTGDNNVIEDHPDQGNANNSSTASYSGYINIDQTGNGNAVWDADQAGSNNELKLKQDGDDKANVEAQVSSKGGSGNDMEITQGSGSNQVGGYSSNGPGAYQEGENNSMNINQNGGAAAGMQSVGTSSALGASNTFFRDQEGGQGLIQVGEGNMMDIDQDGASTVNYLWQAGNNNTFNVEQNGTGNMASGSQAGSGNTSTIIQN